MATSLAGKELPEDAKSAVQNPGFNNPSYPADDYSLPKRSPGLNEVSILPPGARA